MSTPDLATLRYRIATAEDSLLAVQGDLSVVMATLRILPVPVTADHIWAGVSTALAAVRDAQEELREHSVKAPSDD